MINLEVTNSQFTINPSPLKNVPQIRFKGFEGEWEQRTLGELGRIAMNKRIFKHQTSETGEIPFYKIGTFGKEADSFISRKLFDEYKNKFPYPHKGDLLISASGSIGRIVEYSGKDEYFQDSNIVWLQHDGAVVNAFLKQFYSFVEWVGLEGSTIKRLYNKNILETRIVLPKKEEQANIGKYFRALDRLIWLHQRKHDKLVSLKKAMLQKMFPQPGATTPEIRFKGFLGDWKEERLGKLGTFSKGYGYSKSDLSASGTPIVLYGRLYVNYQNEISEVDTFVAESKGAVKSLGKEVIVPASGETAEDIARASAILTEGIILGGDLNIIYPFKDLNSSFLALTLSNGKPQRDLAKRAQGKTVVHLRQPDLESIGIYFPALTEQQKIGSYFRTLDELIAKHATQLQKLQQIKSACLAKMFV